MALPDILARPFHVKELREQFDTGGELADDTYNADVTTEKTALKAAISVEVSEAQTAIDALVDATSLSAGDKTTLNTLKAAIASELTTMRTDIYADVDTNFPDDTPLPIKTALEAAYQIYKAEDEAAHDYKCPQCAGAGKVPIYDATGTATGDYRACPLSDGYGNTTLRYVIDPSTATYIEAP